MAKLSDFLSAGDKDEEKPDGKAANRKAVVRLKLALLVKRMARNKDPKVKSAFAAHLEKSGVKSKE